MCGSTVVRAQASLENFTFAAFRKNIQLAREYCKTQRVYDYLRIYDYLRTREEAEARTVEKVVIFDNPKPVKIIKNEDPYSEAVQKHFTLQSQLRSLEKGSWFWRLINWWSRKRVETKLEESSEQFRKWLLQKA
jgi:hypothetical protein